MKTQILVFLIVVIVLLSFSNVYGDDWICINRDDNGKCWFSYNKKIIRVSKNIVRVVEKIIISDEDKKNDKSYDKDESYSIYLNEIDCKNMTMKLLQSTRYKIDGSVSKSFDLSDGKPRFIVPDSIGEIEYNKVCKPKTK